MLRAAVMTPTRSDPLEDDTLVHLAQKGDRDAFGMLVSRHQRRLWLVCRQYVGPDEADAATQDAFIKAYTSLGSFDRRAAFTTWLTRIGINTCLDQLRRTRRRGPRVELDDDEGSGPAHQLVDDQVDPEARAIQRQTVAALAVAENELPRRQREIFRLRFYGEMELEEIATSLRVHVGTVKTQLHRAVHRLRQELGEVR